MYFFTLLRLLRDLADDEGSSDVFLVDSAADAACSTVLLLLLTKSSKRFDFVMTSSETWLAMRSGIPTGDSHSGPSASRKHPESMDLRVTFDSAGLGFALRRDSRVVPVKSLSTGEARFLLYEELVCPPPDRLSLSEPRKSCESWEASGLSSQLQSVGDLEICCSDQ